MSAKLTFSAVAVSLLIVASGLALDACQRRGPHKPEPQVNAAGGSGVSSASGARPQVRSAALADAPAGIDWLPGDQLETAFSTAATAHKPVFLFWGAVWCPYCKDLKANVFSRADFRAKLRLFVPVYLDGDTEGAQKWGDRFRIAGYPTVLVLGADRTELARIAGGMDIHQYANVLDLVLADAEPVDRLLARAASPAASASSPGVTKASAHGPQTGSRDAGALTADDCRRLAYNAWSLDATLDEDAGRLGKSLDAAAQHCPPDALHERARLVVIAAGLQATSEEKALSSGRAPSPALKQMMARVETVLADQHWAAQNADVLQYLDEPFFQAIAKSWPDKAADWLARWGATMDAAADDTRFTMGDRLAFVNSKLMATKALSPGGKIPAQLIADANHRIDVALERTKDPMPRAGVVNAALNVLETLGDPQHGYDIAAAEVPNTQTPYYYLADMADLADELGRRDEAVSLRERAYRESRGAATRFQWGTGYLLELIRVRPNDDTRIRSAALEVLGELDAPDRLYSRSRTRLARISSTLKQWSAGGRHAETIAAIRKRMGEICGRIPEGDTAKQSCRAFLA